MAPRRCASRGAPAPARVRGLPGALNLVASPAMNRAVRRIVPLVTAIISISAGACGGTAVDCGQLRCSEPLLIYGNLTYLGNEPVDLQVRLCRNGDCSEGEVQAQAMGKAEVTLQGALPAIATLTSKSATEPWELSVRIRDQKGQDGDKVSLRLTTVPGGTVIFDQAATPVTYLITHPNGPECSPTCRNAVIAFEK